MVRYVFHVKFPPPNTFPIYVPHCFVAQQAQLGVRALWWTIGISGGYTTEETSFSSPNNL